MAFGYQLEKKKALVATYTTREFQHPTSGVVNPVTYGVQSIDKPQISNLNSAKSVEALPQSTRPENFPNKEVMDFIPNLSISHNDNANFEFQINEIDSALDKFDQSRPHDNSMTAVVPKSTEINVNPSGENPRSIFTPLVSHNILMENSSKAPLPPNAPTICTWRKLASNNSPDDSDMQDSVTGKRVREEEKTVQPKLPNKKLQVSKDGSHIYSMAEADSQPCQSL